MFRWHSRDKMNDLQEPQKIHYLQTPYGESLLCNQALQKKGPFQRLEVYKHAWLRSTMTHERFSNLTVLNSHKLKERTAKSPITHTNTQTSKEVVNGPLTFKNAPRAALNAAAVVWSWVKKLTSYSSFEEFFGLHRYSLVDFTVAWLLAWYRVD